VKISLAEAAAVSDKSDAVGLVNVAVVDSSPQVINPNGEWLLWVHNPQSRRYIVTLTLTSI
jgi:hypothetical protein